MPRDYGLPLGGVPCLTAGRQEAATYRGMAESNMDRAVERLVEKFKGAAHA